MTIIETISKGFQEEKKALLKEYKEPEGFRTDRDTIEVFKRYQRMAEISEVFDKIQASMQNSS